MKTESGESFPQDYERVYLKILVASFRFIREITSSFVSFRERARKYLEESTLDPLGFCLQKK